MVQAGSRGQTGAQGGPADDELPTGPPIVVDLRPPLADTSSPRDAPPPPPPPGSSSATATQNESSADAHRRPSPSSTTLFLDPEEAERQQKWQEERIERRLRGEYERASRKLASLVDESLDRPFRLNAIRIEGADRTRSSFLAKVCTPYLAPRSGSSSGPTSAFASFLSHLNPFPPSTSSPSPQGGSPADTQPHPQTLRDVLHTVRSVGSDLQRFDIFSSVDANIEQSPSLLADERDVDVVLRVKEKSRVWAKSSTDVGNGEGSAAAVVRIRNAFGGAETIEGSASFGTKTRKAIQLSLSTPVNADPDTTVEAGAFSLDRDYTSFAGAHEIAKGLTAKLKTLSGLGIHELAYEATWRHLGHFTPEASMSMRQLAGHSIKSSLSHSFLRDTRDDPFEATRGAYLRLRQEYAGLGGDAEFVKLEADAQTSRSLGADWSVSLSARTGVVRPLNGKPTLFSDRLHLGGPTSLRMFRLNSLGPKDGFDSLGGDLMWATGLSLIGPVPKKEHWPIKAHAFVNAGQLSQIDPTKPLVESLSTSASSLLFPSVSAGLGIIYHLGGVRVELNAGLPLVARKQDGYRKGLQLGIGIDFL